MKLIPGWRKELNLLWSIRVAIVLALLPVADQILALFDKYIPPFWYAIMSMLIIVARVLDQTPKVKDENKPSGT